MTKEERIDEIDWLLSDIKLGRKNTPEHIFALGMLGIECETGIIVKKYSDIIEELKIMREGLAGE